MSERWTARREAIRAALPTAATATIAGGTVLLAALVLCPREVPRALAHALRRLVATGRSMRWPLR